MKDTATWDGNTQAVFDAATLCMDRNRTSLSKSVPDVVDRACSFLGVHLHPTQRTQVIDELCK